MTRLDGFPTATQAVSNSCWACAGREIVNWYIGQGEAGSYQASQFDSDQKFADQYATAAKDPAYKDIDVQRSAADALAYLGFDNNTDSRPIPEPDEIRVELRSKKPMLAIIGSTNPGKKPNLDAKEGHWLVIVGINDDGSRIEVFDPALGKVVTVAYGATYTSGSYWQNTSYVDAHA
ncbi:hypothetical protein J5226_09490 [Lysobacter sp. K5869]|uniref:papain-like cysteine protease family protein n=1 Tax=Lysobacter sp. K5869 TaxID=2820808 RepID=UPI001C06114E|nr:papain-like cysteine protease family protein [Lysobacter sp. K5869]QWP78602.1 hypothetical protein J5226_09490 [Lysobacter sp. K5869]